MSATTKPRSPLARMLSRWNGPALQNALQHINQLAAQSEADLRAIELQQHEIESLKERLKSAEDIAESWRQDALEFQLDLCRIKNAAPGIDINGRLHVVESGEPA